MTGADVSFKDTAGIGAGAHGAEMTVDRAAAVAHRGSLCTVTFDNALVAVTFAHASDVDFFAGSKYVCLDDVANIHFICILKTELFQMLQHADTGFFQVSLFRLGKFLVGNFFVSELYGFITVTLFGLFLNYHARTCFNVPASSKICVMPTFLPIMAFFIIYPPLVIGCLA